MSKFIFCAKSTPPNNLVRPDDGRLLITVKHPRQIKTYICREQRFAGLLGEGNIFDIDFTVGFDCGFEINTLIDPCVSNHVE